MYAGQHMFDTMWSKLPGLVNTLDNEGEMDTMLASTHPDMISYTSVLVPTLSWDPVTDHHILTAPASTWVETGSGIMSREDVARFMMSVVENQEEWSRRAVAITVECSKDEEASAFQRLMKKMKSSE